MVPLSLVIECWELSCFSDTVFKKAERQNNEYIPNITFICVNNYYHSK